MNMSEVRDLLVAIAAIVSTLGIPFLVALIWRMHDKQIDVLKLFTFKEIEGQIVSMKAVYERVNDQLRDELAALKAEQADMPLLESKKRLAIIQNAIATLRDTNYVLGESPDRDMLRRMFALSNSDAFRETQLLLEQLSAYETDLKGRIEKQSSK